MSLTKLKYDDCFKNQQNKSNKSIFDYMTDNTNFINKNSCMDTTPTFLSYIPLGTPSQNIDIENTLRGSNRIISKCSDCKYSPDLANDGPIKLNLYPNNKSECKSDFKILPNGYFNN